MEASATGMGPATMSSVSPTSAAALARMMATSRASFAKRPPAPQTAAPALAQLLSIPHPQTLSSGQTATAIARLRQWTI